MIEDDQLILIDFNRNDWGDPWEEFNRIVWCAQSAPTFASGMVDGYFDYQPTMMFWQLLALYISSKALSSLPWSISSGQQEVDTILSMAREILGWYDNMNSVIPSWYRK